MKDSRDSWFPFGIKGGLILLLMNVIMLFFVSPKTAEWYITLFSIILLTIFLTVIITIFKLKERRKKNEEKVDNSLNNRSIYSYDRLPKKKH